MKRISVRNSKKSDIDILNEIMHSSTAYQGEYQKILDGYFVSEKQLETDHFVVAEDQDGEILGFCSLKEAPQPELDLMFVKDSAQGLGVGKILFEAICEYCKRKNLKSFMIVSHPPALPFYLRMGAEQIGMKESSGRVSWSRPILTLSVFKNPSPGFSVRTAVLDDVNAMGSVHTESWKTTYAGVVHQSFLDSIDINARIQGAVNRVNNLGTDCLVLVENENKKVVGFAQVGPCREKNVESDGELYAIYLYQQYQGKGGGRLLFEASVAKAKLRGYSKMMVSVFEQNMSSRKFYEKMGGKYIGSDHVDIEEYRYPTSTYLWILE